LDESREGAKMIDEEDTFSIVRLHCIKCSVLMVNIT